MNEFTLSFDDSSKSYTVLSMAELLEELTELHACSADKFFSNVFINDVWVVDFIIALYLITCDYGLYTLNTYLLRNGWVEYVQGIPTIDKQDEDVKEAYQNLTQFGNTAYPYSIN